MLRRLTEYAVICDGPQCHDCADVRRERADIEAYARSQNWLNLGKRWFCPACAKIIVAKRPELENRKSLTPGEA